jgi:hypothetical protein
VRCTVHQYVVIRIDGNGDGFRLMKIRGTRKKLRRVRSCGWELLGEAIVVEKSVRQLPRLICFTQWIEARLERRRDAASSWVWIESRRGHDDRRNLVKVRKSPRNGFVVRASSGIDDLEREYLLAVNRLATLPRERHHRRIQSIENRISATRGIKAAR